MPNYENFGTTNIDVAVGIEKKKSKKREVICSFVVWGQIRHFVQYSNIILLLEKFLEVPPPGAVGSEFFFFFFGH